MKPIFDVVVESVDDTHCTVRGPDGTSARLSKTVASTVGQVGMLTHTKQGGFAFEPYLEQRLRRFPGHDDGDGYWWWKLTDQPDDDAVAVKAGVVPGINGFIHLEDVYPVQLEVPREFKDLCEEVGLEPAAVLRLFIADACNLMSNPQRPREDAYSASSAPARGKASEYLQSLLQALR